MYDNIIKLSTNLKISKGKILLDNHKTIEADPQLELNLQMPLSAPQQMTYKGSITLSDGHIRGFAPLEYLDNVELDLDFKNDEAVINALSVNVLDTNIKINGTVNNFKKPFLNITAEADELNLTKIKDLARSLVDQYGLAFDGTSFVKVKFEGLMADPLAGKILAVATVKNVSVSSSKFQQKIKNITGIIEATPDSLKWHDMTVTYMDQKYALSGTLDNFKNPNVLASITGPHLDIKANLVKNNDLVTINALTGKYLNTAFDTKGTIALAPGREPVFDLNANVSLLLENLIKVLPAQQKKDIEPLNPTGMINMTANLKGTGTDWKNYTINTTFSSPVIRAMGYSLNDIKINIDQDEGKIKNMTFDGKFYDGIVHAVGSLGLTTKDMPYELAFNIDSTDMHKLKMDSPLKMEEIDGKFYFTSIKNFINIFL